MQDQLDSHGIATSNRIAFSAKELAERIGCSVAFVRLEIHRGRLRAAKLGKRVVIAQEAVREWLDHGQQVAK